MAETFGMEESEVLQANSDSHHQIRETSRVVLYSWFNGTDRNHQELLHQLKHQEKSINHRFIKRCCVISDTLKCMSIILSSKVPCNCHTFLCNDDISVCILTRTYPVI